MEIIRKISKDEFQDYLYNIDLQDEKVYKELNDENTIGIFQFNGALASGITKQVHPKTFDEMIAINSLARPGTSSFVPDYIAGKDDNVLKYPSKINDLLKDTYGLCIFQDEIIFTKNGRKKIKDVVEGEEVYSINIDNGDIELDVVTEKFSNGVKEYYEVELKNGGILRATGEHKFLTVFGWKTLNEIISNNYQILMKRGFNFSLNNIGGNPHRAKIIGYLIGDGDLTSGVSVNFINKDNDIIKDYIKSVEEYFPDSKLNLRVLEQVRNVKRISFAGSIREGTYIKNDLLNFMREIGFKDKFDYNKNVNSHTKFIPNEVFSYSYENINYFLSAIWDTDGSQSKYDFRYKTVSNKLVTDLYDLLVFIGYIPKITKSLYKGTVSYSLLISGLDYDRFIDDVVSKCSSKRFKKIKKAVNEDFSSKVYFKHLNYNKKERIGRELARKLNLKSRKSIYSFLNGGRINKNVFDRLFKQVFGSDKYKNIYFADIKTVSKKEGMVYDINTKKNHNFIYNGVITHNCIFQEQIMSIFNVIGGFSLEETNAIRGLMKKLGKADKSEEDIKKWDKAVSKFTKGALENGLTKNEADNIANDLLGMSSYSFNKSHATAYSYIAVMTLYLSHYFKKYFLASVLQNQIDDSKDVFSSIQSIRNQNIEVFPPDINKSGVEVSALSDSKLLLGLKNIKKVSVTSAEHIVERRPYENLFDFITKTEGKKIRVDVIKALISVGAFDFETPERKRLLLALEIFWSNKKSIKVKEKLQIIWDKAYKEAMSIKGLNVDNSDLKEFENEYLGGNFFTSSFPNNLLIAFKKLKERNLIYYNFNEATAIPKKIPVYIQNIRLHTDKNGNEMAFLIIEDVLGQTQKVPIFASFWTHIKDVISNNSFCFLQIYKNEDSYMFGAPRWISNKKEIERMAKAIL